jgi:hypothetical protein
MTWSKLAVIILAVSLASCVPWYGVDDDYDPTFPEVQPTGATSPQEIGVWLYQNIRYVGDAIHDESEYWQSPDQTYVWASGDCEDFALLMMYLIHTELGGWPELAIGKYYDTGHGWVLYEGRQFEPQTGRDVTDDPQYTLSSTVSYGISMWRSTHTHRSILSGL